MDLKKYNNRKVELIDDEEQKWVGMAYFSDADTAEEDEDILTIKSNKGSYNSFLESMIENVKILD